ncbi:tellurium resistance protein putative [Photobacterium aphoticum]|uniref:Tellurium resistance protein putative n=1 Tax=Photobacterium aphoticum TaxID=754436 RepID=A0A090QMN5_9GAMM|nr:tellurium resistance protein putative [Photobacterium aphoticum]
MELQKGGNCALAASQGTIYIKHSASSQVDVNLTAFLLDETGKVLGDEGMVFFNQPADPQHIARFTAPKTSADQTVHQLDFSLRPASQPIAKIAITLTEDKGTGFAGLDLSAEVHCNGTVTVLTPQSFTTEKGIIVAEVYLRNGQCKLRSVWQGFATGLAGLCGMYGIEVEAEPETELAPSPTPAPTSVPISKPTPAPSVNLQKVSGKVDLTKGQKAVLIEKTPEITASISWNSGTDYDVYALVLLNDGTQVDVATFGAEGVPARPNFDNGAVRHGGDVKQGKSSFFSAKPKISKEEINIRLNDRIKAVVPVAYSAQSNGSGSFYRYKVSMMIDNHQGTEIHIPAENANQNDAIYTCVPGIIINTPDGVMIKALEYYSQQGSENRPMLVVNAQGEVDVRMDVGPMNDYK